MYKKYRIAPSSNVTSVENDTTAKVARITFHGGNRPNRVYEYDTKDVAGWVVPNIMHSSSAGEYHWRNIRNQEDLPVISRPASVKNPQGAIKRKKVEGKPTSWKEVSAKGSITRKAKKNRSSEEQDYLDKLNAMHKARREGK